MRRLFSLLLLGGFGLAVVGCDAASRPTKRSELSSASTSKTTHTNKSAKSSEKPRPSASDPMTLMRDRSSAYAATILPRRDEILITTATDVIRVAPDKQVEKIHVQLGDVQVLHDDSIAFFRDGAIRAFSLEDRNERLLFAVEYFVQYLLSSAGRLAWLSHEKQGRYFVQTESAGSVKTLYTSNDEVTWPVLHDETVYFLERSGGAWRIGRAPLNGSAVKFGKEYRGRVPAMLAAGPDGLYFYDGPKRGVRKLAFDLESEEPIAQGTICAPLAVSSRVVCAQVGGIVDIAHPLAEPRTIARETDGPIADIAATDERVYWIVDRGRDQMTVRSAELPSL